MAAAVSDRLSIHLQKMNKNFRQITFVCALLLAFGVQFSTAQTSQKNSPRIIYTINDNWRFLPDNASEAEKPSKSDGNWEIVNLPHTWNAQDAFDDTPDYRRGASWYRKNLQVGSDLKGRRIYLYFEGANQTADVYVNEKFVGNHIGGYTAFAFDVTDAVKFGENNLIAVKVDNSFNADIPPLTADFTFYGGIYRDVWLIATDELHFKTTDYASSGVTVTTPNLSATSSAIVNVRGTVVNDSSKKRNFDVLSQVFDAEGKEVNNAISSVAVEPKAEAGFENETMGLKKFNLWSPENPYLYTVKTTIRENGVILDEVSNPLGFRWFKYDGNGFYLNGKPVKLRGANRHQDYKGLGNAVPDSIHVRDMELMKSAGYNFVRLAHYPQDPAILQAADRLGIMLWEETPLVNYITISQKFNENSAQMLREMIRQHRNHPSVIMWGYMNEIYLRVPKENAENIRKETVTLARNLDKIAHEEDSTRPTTIAFHGNDIYNQMKLGEIPNIVGWNLYSGWYSNKFEDFGKFIDEQHRRYPNRPLIISEYGGNSDLRLHSNASRRFDSTTEYQRLFHESYVAQMNARPYLLGSTLWNEFDFGAELRGENMPHVNNKGMWTYDRKPKDVHYFYKANWSGEPVLHIAANDWKTRAASELKPQKIDVYSNLPQVELFLNGVSLGVKKPDAIRKATWDVNFKDGANSLEARGTRGAMKMTDEVGIDFKLVTAGSPEIAVNVGSNADFIDESGVVWLADQPYKQGSFGYTGQISPTAYGSQNDKNILGTEDDPLFQTMQENLSSYRFDVPAGVYEIELKFAETKFEKTNQRVFDVSINGRKLLEKLDLAKDFGAQRAVTKRFRIDAVNGIVIDFAAIQGKPILSGVKINRL